MPWPRVEPVLFFNRLPRAFARSFTAEPVHHPGPHPMTIEEPPSYVRQILDQAQRYAHELLVENDRLRMRVAAQEGQRVRLEERLGNVDDLLSEMDLLREHVATLERDKRRLQDHLSTAQVELEAHRSARDEIDRLHGEARQESIRYSERYALVESGTAALANLYAACHRLHGTRDRRRALAIIHAIVAELIGSEELLVYERAPNGTVLRLVASFGIDPKGHEGVPLGVGRVGRAAATGAPDIGATASETERAVERDLTACIPLKLDGQVTGLLAVFRLLPRKAALAPIDHALFELLATHAATALFCTDAELR
jgi:GAF domain-containing protein